MDSSLLTQTIISGALVSACLLVLLHRFAPRRAHWPQIVAGIIVLDQGSKWLVRQLVAGGAVHAYVGGGIEISRYTNHLQGFGSTSPVVLYATLVGVIGVIRLYQMLVERRYVMSAVTEVALALILGAVAVTAVERAWSGHVMDFLQFGPSGAYVYNLCDLAAFAGGFILFVRGMMVLPGVIQAELALARAGEGRE